ncbi:MAG: 50S ribosomal protein L9 [Oscillospiraceae bacterium]|nr:50S ribosomal protein L9 [Oscillospiraceae bacterium]
MKVILQQDVRSKGKKGQLIEVSDGYARNFLFPKKLAVEATADNINTMKLQEKARLAQIEREKAQAKETAEKLADCKVKVLAKAGAGGKLFGSVTTKEISDALSEQYGVKIEKNRIVSDPIKSYGVFNVKCKLGYDITAQLTVEVGPEN